MPPLTQDLMASLISLAQDAGQRIIDIYQTDFDVTHKSDQSPVTAADFAAHHAILAGLNILTPELPVLSEESEEIPYQVRAGWDTYWLVDPLDGTREFIRRNGEFTVNIALIHCHRPVLGVIYAPVSGLCYYACEGQGAYKLPEGGTPQRIRTRSSRQRDITIAGSRSHPGSLLPRFLSNLKDYRIIPMGSSLKSCLVAEGRVDIYPRLGPTCEWDTAAAQCIVEEAGGLLTDTSLRPLRYNTKDSLLNPHFIAFGDPSYNWSPHLKTAESTLAS